MDPLHPLSCSPCLSPWLSMPRSRVSIRGIRGVCSSCRTLVTSDLGINLIVTLEKQLLKLIGNLV
jgi:hypothetical protein